jgi:hypothetical protein
MTTRLTYAVLAVVAAVALGVISVGAFDFGRDLKRLVTQSPIIVINVPPQGSAK